MHKINTTISTLCYILETKIKFTKLKSFLSLKEYFINKRANYKKAEIIYLYFQRIFKNLFKIKEKNEKKHLNKLFHVWKYTNLKILKIEKIKEDLKKQIANKFNNKLDEIKIVENRELNHISDMKNNISMNQVSLDLLDSKLRDLENKKINYLQNINVLQDEKILIEEEMLIISNKLEPDSFMDSLKNEEDNSNLNLKEISSDKNKKIKGKRELLEGLEKKINEYENKITILSQENYGKDVMINSYMQEMNEVLNTYEKNCSLIFLFKKLFIFLLLIILNSC